MASLLDYLTQGSRIFVNGYKRRLFKQKFEGDAREICTHIVAKCYNGRFFQTSLGNFPQFWSRDFGWCASSLIKLGYQEEVHKTLRFALNNFRKHRKVTTTLTPSGKPFDFPVMAVDSLPWLIHTIKISKFGYHSFKPFLNKQIELYFEQVVNEHTGLVKPDSHFSSMKDFAIRKSSCYDNCMLAMLARDLESMKLINPFTKFNYPELIKRHFWSGEFFYDDLSKSEYVAGDANLFPFLLGIINDEGMKKKALHSIIKYKLDSPLPLKYTHSRNGVSFIWQEIFLMNYESDALWQHMGPLYIKLLATVDKERADALKKKLGETIEKHGNFLEVFNAKGKPYSTPFYYCDTGMLWAANFLTL